MKPLVVFPRHSVTHYLHQNHMQQLELRLTGDYIELNQLLKVSGLCDSGGAGKMLVSNGVVSVDGKVELRKTCKVHANQVVSIGDVHIHVLPAL